MRHRAATATPATTDGLSNEAHRVGTKGLDAGQGVHNHSTCIAASPATCTHGESCIHRTTLVVGAGSPTRSTTAADGLG